MNASPATKPDERAELVGTLVDDADGLANYVWPLRRPLALLLNILSAGLRLLRPFAPQIVPLVVFVLTIPVIVFFSLSAGWLVWRSVAVGWEVEVYFQYGYACDVFPPVPCSRALEGSARVELKWMYAVTSTRRMRSSTSRASSPNSHTTSGCTSSSPPPNPTSPSGTS